MLKMLFLLHLPPPVHGSSVIGKSIAESKLLNETINGCYINLLASKNVKSTGKLTSKKLFHALFVMLRIVKQVLFFKPELCYVALTTTGIAFYRDFIYVLILKIFGVKIIFHLHNKGVSRFRNPLKKAIYRYVFNNAKVILLSKSLYSDIQEYVSPKDVFICPNGISPSTLLINNKPKNTPVKLLFLSNLIISKGVYVLIDALSILEAKGLDFSCDLVGGEGDISRPLIEKYISTKNLQDKTCYRGKKNGKYKYECYRNADIFVFPTFYKKECFPLVVLEAMQQSLPVISTDEGGIPNIVEDGVTGFIVEKQNPVALAEKIELLLKDYEIRINMGQNGYLKYKRYYTLEKFENNMKEIFNSYAQKQ